MKRNTRRNNSFTPHGRHAMGTTVNRLQPRRNLRSVIRNATDFIHDHPFIIVITLGLAVYATWYTLSRPQVTRNDPFTPATSSASAPRLEKGIPDYDTVVPKGMTPATITWTRVSPPDHNPVYTYIDTIGKVTINVSEQPIPDDFQVDPVASVEKLASSYNANQKIIVGSDTVYIGTSEKGPQSVIFIKNNVLVLIKTDTGLSTDQWMSYISSLQ